MIHSGANFSPDADSLLVFSRDECRFGWPARSDMYILRTDGNACARTLVKGTLPQIRELDMSKYL